jgi:hypothetical protein
MPVPGLALIGFMEEQMGITYLQQRCIPKSAALPDLHACWADARGRLGPPAARAGYPEILEIPSQHDAYVQAVAATPRFAEYQSYLAAGATVSFKLAEIEPLLAYQFHIETDRSASLCAFTGNGVGLDTILPICLPHQMEDIPFFLTPLENGLVIKTKSANLTLRERGIVGVDPQMGFQLAGAIVGARSPLVQVAQFQGRCYLRNGFHRTYGLRLAGATHVPCVFIEMSDFGQVGIMDGRTFSRDLLESANPPTCGHYTQGRAYPVALRSMNQYIAINWSEYVLPDE